MGLAAQGWNQSEDRLQALCEMFVVNEVVAWHQLGRAGDPGRWPGADAFREEELHFLRKLQRVGGQVPRCVVNVKHSRTCLTVDGRMRCERSPPKGRVMYAMLQDMCALSLAVFLCA